MNQWEEKRESQRIEVAVPVYIGNEKAVTRDISWSGVYFMTNQSFSEGSEVNFSMDLEFALPGKPVKLDCQGEVIRVEKLNGKFGIAAKINNYQYLH